MSVELALLFVEKSVEAARLCASLTEPFVTGAVPASGSRLADDLGLVASRLEQALASLKKLGDELEANNEVDPGDRRHARQRISATVSEIARAAQDFSAQVRLFQAMVPEKAAAVAPVLPQFEAVERATRELILGEADPASDDDELAPVEPDDEPPIDPMLM